MTACDHTEPGVAAGEIDHTAQGSDSVDGDTAPQPHGSSADAAPSPPPQTPLTKTPVDILLQAIKAILSCALEVLKQKLQNGTKLPLGERLGEMLYNTACCVKAKKPALLERMLSKKRFEEYLAGKDEYRGVSGTVLKSGKPPGSVQ